MSRVEANSISNSGNAWQPADFLRLMATHCHWWIVPAVAGAVLASAYSLVANREWKASQALIIRPEVASVSEERLGKFSDLSEMKTSQETVLELAKSQSVIQATLSEVGPASGKKAVTNWPTAVDIARFRDDIDMRPPGGAEFGKTEVFYLSIKASNRDRATALVASLCGQLERRMQELRDQRAQGMIAELERTVEMADGDLAAQTSKLSSFEAKIGADLGELRSLTTDIGGQGETSQELHAIETERRANDAAQQQNERLLKLLVAAKDNPQRLLATPNSLLASQPAIGQLKSALVAAQLRTADLLSTRSENHPFVIAAKDAEQSIRKQLNGEVAVAIRALEAEVELCADREKSLAANKSAARDRISQLAGTRAEYSNIVNAVQNQTRLVEAARKNLADARARHAAAHSACVINRIDGVEAGVKPVGIGRTSIAAAGGVGGLCLGVGCLFLFGNKQSPSPVSTALGENVAAYLREAARNVKRKRVSSAASVATTGINDSVTAPSRSVAETFGMFRGLSLSDAVQAVQRQSQTK